MTSRRPRLAFVSPLPPVRSGIADYARDLLPHLGGAFEVELFVDEAHPALGEGRYLSYPVRSGRDLPARFREFDHVVYQMGNNVHHRFVLDLARRYPAVVVLHEVVLHHLYEEVVTREDEWEAYAAALGESYGAVGDAVVRWKRWKLDFGREHFVLPLFESLVAASRGAIVHNRAAERDVLRRLPGKAVRRVPMGIPAEPAADPREARRRLGLADDQVIVGVFGLLTTLKRLEELAAALRDVWREHAELRLVMIGEVGSDIRLEELFAPQEFASGRVVWRGYVGAEEYRDWMAATDIAVNLRYPTAGETSASLLRLLGDGKCTLISSYRQFLEIPAEAAVRIPLGAEEAPALRRELAALARDGGRRARIGAAARAFVAAEHAMPAAAAAFADAVRELGSRPLPSPPDSPIWRFRRTSRVAAIHGSVRREQAGELQARAGALEHVDLVVRNEGESQWISTAEPSGGHVGVGADVLSGADTRVARLRPVALDRDLRPGEEAPVRLALQAPTEPGEYRIQPTIVHFGRGRARIAGSPIPLIVTADPPARLDGVGSAH